VADVNVRIDTLTHTWDADVSIYLQRGTIGSLIVDNVGGSGDNFIGTILNDSAATPIASGVAPFTGSFRPSNPLTPFNGAFTSGYWRLVVTDTAGGDSGLLKAWCLVITYTNCTGIQQTIEIPNYYSLGQNYPNPFNPVTNIKFSIPQSQDVKLVVFDILGREVATLVNEYKTSGVYQVDFDASHLASGVYFYSLQTPNFTQTKRMLLVK
jgi:subtilisin-like proprotein convertase family protein